MKEVEENKENDQTSHLLALEVGKISSSLMLISLHLHLSPNHKWHTVRRSGCGLSIISSFVDLSKYRVYLEHKLRWIFFLTTF